MLFDWPKTDEPESVLVIEGLGDGACKTIGKEELPPILPCAPTGICNPLVRGVVRGGVASDAIDLPLALFPFGAAGSFSSPGLPSSSEFVHASIIFGFGDDSVETTSGDDGTLPGIEVSGALNDWPDTPEVDLC
jgi:hypothetical protein|eukprot:CAMPEP_0169285574 /NCGR_PEP_ID=MMETSP1016-20121227/58778_1 /TAXON_ID=342587 /ORGANISM="Karlodinium micrum, Strain CCMP2283" /LENGTH=133 /DNA_ID=CAMNT_0009375105 /DNA_START=149 /DNA_END=550 /DNA_ORIENTATION=+